MHMSFDLPHEMLNVSSEETFVNAEFQAKPLTVEFSNRYQPILLENSKSSLCNFFDKLSRQMHNLKIHKRQTQNPRLFVHLLPVA